MGRVPLPGRLSALQNAGERGEAGGRGDLLRERGGLGPAPPAPRPPGHSEALTDLDGRLAAQQQLQALGVVRQAAVVQGCAAFRRLLVQVPAGEDGEEAGAESRPRQVPEMRAGERPAAGQSPAALEDFPQPLCRGGGVTASAQAPETSGEGRDGRRGRGRCATRLPTRVPTGDSLSCPAGGGAFPLITDAFARKGKGRLPKVQGPEAPLSLLTLDWP